MSEIINQLNQFETTLQYQEINVPSNDTALRLRYQDIHSDFLSLQTHKIIDLINKKLTILHQLTDENTRKNVLTKIAELLIVSNYDFRKFEIINYIKNQPLSLDPLTNEVFNKLVNQQIIPLEMFQTFLSQAKSLIISKFNQQKLVQNLIQTNLSVLPKYYKSIYLQNLDQLLGTKVDEILISRMISNGDLPGKINQLENILVFKETSMSNQVFRMVDEISSRV